MNRFLFLLSYLLLLASTLSAQKGETHNAEIGHHLELFDDIYRQLDLYYVDSLSADTTIGWAIKSMLSHVDPFTQYYAEDDEELRQMATGKYAGIGSVIRYNQKAERAMIIEPYEGTPSQLTGLMAGDIILTIDGTDVRGKLTPEVSSMLRGEPGTSFELRVQRMGHEKPLSFRITRQTISMPSVPYYGMQSDGIGYIYLSSFASGSAQEMRHALTDLRAQGMKALVLDLRENGGGAIEEAVSIVNMFVQKGQKVVYTKGKVPSSNRDYYTTQEPLDTITPIVVLVNGSTASAAEILSGSLQDMDRAVVIGRRTYGKGLVQAIHDVPYRGNLKITISRYYIPSGRCIQAYDYRHLTADGRVGTVPDSLTNVFYTKGGREVRDGGGIKPDMEVQEDSLTSLAIDLVNSDEMFDFCTLYVQQHPTIAPAGEFHLTEDEYRELVKYISESKFEHHRRTDEVMRLLREAARLEGCYEQAEEEFKRLEQKLQSSLSDELLRQRQQITPYIEDEIVGRYYFQRGRARHLLLSDKFYDQAARILKTPSEYNQILNP